MQKPSPDTLPNLLTIKEVAVICQVSLKTVRRWIEVKELAAAKLGAQWRIRPKDLDLFIREHLNW
jgi:excisionase family DNA binding protein|tara:strand:- start:765 stop:959 length:195 start_codon:yes stop_codon:yes gene_type:complete